MSAFDGDKEEQARETMAPFLSQRLDELGLDHETYGAYLIPLLLSQEDGQEDEWDSVIELLRASSESHCDDNNAWNVFRTDLQNEWRQQLSQVEQRKQELHEREEQKYQEQLERERQAAQEAERLKLEKEQEKKKMNLEDAAKQALVARYGYDDDDEEGEDASDEEQVVLSNKQVAELAMKEQQNELRKQSVSTKKDEQQKTAQARLEKARLKEERRKKATKGERKR